jgi:hypothetical protein
VTDAAPVPSADPQERLTVHVDSEERELFMSYNLLRELMKLIPKTDSLEAAFGMLLSPDYADAVLAACLARRNEKGKVLENCDLDEVMITPATADKVCVWAQAHIANFTIGRLASLKSLQDQVQKPLEHLGLSQTG